MKTGRNWARKLVFFFRHSSKSFPCLAPQDPQRRGNVGPPSGCVAPPPPPRAGAFCGEIFRLDSQIVPPYETFLIASAREPKLVLLKGNRNIRLMARLGNRPRCSSNKRNPRADRAKYPFVVRIKWLGRRPRLSEQQRQVKCYLFSRSDAWSTFWDMPPAPARFSRDSAPRSIR